MKLLNKRRDKIPSDAVYIGRPGPYGNPFVLGQDGDRDQVIEKYSAWLETQPELKSRIRRDLRGKTLVCWCSPQSCHGDVILRVANSIFEE